LREGECTTTAKVSRRAHCNQQETFAHFGPEFFSVGGLILLTGRVHAPMNARKAGDTLVSGDLVVDRRIDRKACAEELAKEVPSARQA
jgi:hypothetical protein